MEVAAAWLLAILGPTLVGAGVLHGARLARAIAVRLQPAPDRAAGPPIERLAADLRRLRARQAAVAATATPGKAVRLRGVQLAYDDTLVAACRALEVTGSERLHRCAGLDHDVLVLTLERALREAGLDLTPA